MFLNISFTSTDFKTWNFIFVLSKKVIKHRVTTYNDRFQKPSDLLPGTFPRGAPEIMDRTGNDEQYQEILIDIERHM